MRSVVRTSRNKQQKLTVIQKALRDIEFAFSEIKTTPVRMNTDELEKRIAAIAKRDGTPYSTEPGMWLDNAKKAVTDPNAARETKNIYLAEAYPEELRPALRKFMKSFLTLCQKAEWSYKELKAFCDDSKKDAILRAFLRWHALPQAEALHKFQQLQTKGKMTREKYLKLRPMIVLRTAQ